MGARPAGSDEIIPSWAPDRDALAWSANGIVLLEDGAEPVDLPSPEGVNPEWSPDGRLLATATDEGLVRHGSHGRGTGDRGRRVRPPGRRLRLAGG